MIISIYSEKTFDKTQHNLGKKTLERLVVEGTYLNTIKVVYNKHIATILLNREKLKDILTEDRQGCWLFPFRFNTVLEILAGVVRPEK